VVAGAAVPAHAARAWGEAGGSADGASVPPPRAKETGSRLAPGSGLQPRSTTRTTPVTAIAQESRPARCVMSGKLRSPHGWSSARGGCSRGVRKRRRLSFVLVFLLLAARPYGIVLT